MAVLVDEQILLCQSNQRRHGAPSRWERWIHLTNALIPGARVCLLGYYWFDWLLHSLTSHVSVRAARRGIRRSFSTLTMCPLSTLVRFGARAPSGHDTIDPMHRLQKYAGLSARKQKYFVEPRSLLSPHYGPYSTPRRRRRRQFASTLGLGRLSRNEANFIRPSRSQLAKVMTIRFGLIRQRNRPGKYFSFSLRLGSYPSLGPSRILPPDGRAAAVAGGGVPAQRLQEAAARAGV